MKYSGSQPGRCHHTHDRIAVALVRVILLLGSIAVVSWSLLTSVSSWFYGTGIGREGGRYLLRKGNLVIDPGQTLGAVLYAVSLVLIWS